MNNINPIDVFGDSLFFVLKDLIRESADINAKLEKRMLRRQQMCENSGLGRHWGDFYSKNDLCYLYWNKRALDNASRWYRKLEMKQGDDFRDMTDRAKEMNICDLFSEFVPSGNFSKQIKCPFHPDKSPSLKIYPNTNSWHCFGCNEGGSTVDFIMKRHNLDFVEAVKFLN